jgi:hypothetical protein
MAFASTAIGWICADFAPVAPVTKMVVFETESGWAWQEDESKKTGPITGGYDPYLEPRSCMTVRKIKEGGTEFGPGC